MVKKRRVKRDIIQAPMPKDVAAIKAVTEKTSSLIKAMPGKTDNWFKSLIKNWFWWLCALFSVLFLYGAYMMRDMGMAFWTFAFIFLWVFSYLMFRPPKYNGILWKHPKNGGGIELIKRDPEKGQKRWDFKFRWYDMFLWWPCYIWYEEKGDSFDICPFSLAYSGIMTPEELADTIDWDALYDAFPDEEPTMGKIIKAAIPMLLIGGLIFACIMVVDMLPKAAGR